MPKKKKKSPDDWKGNWENSKAKQQLKKWFKEGKISVNYSAKDGGQGPQEVWNCGWMEKRIERATKIIL